MGDTLADTLRRQAGVYHGYADDTLRTCRYRRPCGSCVRAADGYRAIADDQMQRAIEQDIKTGVVPR